ncbi:MAG: hypothetical protein WC248_08800 [Candidatus Methanomethylophilaceae archaeon]
MESLLYCNIVTLCEVLDQKSMMSVKCTSLHFEYGKVKMIEKNESVPIYWVVVLIISVVGVATVFMSWMDITLLGFDASYNATDFATSDVFKEGGLFDNLDSPGKYIPISIGVLSLIEVILAIRSRTDAVAAAVVGFLIFVLAVYFYSFVDPMSNGSVISDRQVGIAVWIAMAVGLISMIAAAIQHSMLKRNN